MPTTTHSPPRILKQAQALESLILKSLQKQHSWTAIKSHPYHHSGATSEPPSKSASALPLPLLSGLPPTRLYVSPRAQEEFLRALAVLERDERGERSEPAKHSESVEQAKRSEPVKHGESTEQSKQSGNQEDSLHSTEQGDSLRSPDSTEQGDSLRSSVSLQKAQLEREFQAPRREFVACAWKNANTASSQNTNFSSGITDTDANTAVASAPAVADAPAGVSLARLAATFEQLDTIRRDDGTLDTTGDAARMLLAIVDTDSTIVFYVVHDGIVKARQN